MWSRERATAHRSSVQRKSPIYTYNLYSVLKHTQVRCVGMKTGHEIIGHEKIMP
jgi:hypothetical protein